jgi:serine/threonine protein kinase
VKAVSQGHDPLVGRLISGRIEIRERIGGGGMGRVYRAYHRTLDKMIAIKVLKNEPDERLSASERLKIEARAASRLDHPNSVRILDFGEDGPDGLLYIAMEYLEGRVLKDVFEKEERISAVRIARIIAQVCSALSEAHQKGIVHRDLKPANVMLVTRHTDAGPDDEFVKVCDYGLAKVVDFSQLAAEELTGHGLLLGTPGFMAPEQMQGRPLDHRIDLFPCGVMMYRGVTGRLPYSGRNFWELNNALQNLRPTPISQHVPNISETFEKIVSKAMAVDPAARYQTAAEMREALRGWLASIGVELVSDSSGQSSTAIMDKTIADVRPDPQMTFALCGIDSPMGQPDLRERGQRLIGHTASPNTEARALKPDVWLLNVDRGDPLSGYVPWKDLCPSHRTLVAVDSGFEGAHLIDAVGSIPNLMIGPHPVDPLAVSIALSWVNRPQSPGMEHLIGDASRRSLQINSTALKSYYVDTVLEELKNREVSPRAQRDVATMCEEMIMNAVFHAPIDSGGHKMYAGVNRGARVSLRPEEESVLSWTVTDRHVALSIRDPFGSLRASDLLTRLFDKSGASPSGISAGMGFRLMLRTSRHLFFSIAPGRWTEVLALVERQPGAMSNERTVSVLQAVGPAFQDAGDGLSICEAPSPHGVRIELRGEINESSKLHAIYRHAGRVRVDLSQVTRVNSAGIYQWMQAAREKKADSSITFERCSPAVVVALGVREIAASAKITSVLSPYYCRQCKQERQQLLSIDTLSIDEIRAGTAPAKSCESCGSPLIFDDMPEEYFSFLDV